MWVILAVLASMFWGTEYAINEQIYRHISVTTALAIEGVVYAAVFVCIMVLSGNAKADLATLGSSWRLAGLMLAGSVGIIIAALFIGFSITAKSAALAGLIEISYPLFTALFAYVLFKEGELTWATALGGLFIIAGVGIIYRFGH